jgi:16S rRNA (guanine(966)-N(2))-methyltransferase RsmD
MAVIIMGGRYKGRTLLTDTRSSLIRPTSGKVREALFSSLGPALEGESFVDLYAGSGAVGLEALSRGAGEAHLVESHPQSWSLLQANCKAVLGSRSGAAGSETGTAGSASTSAESDAAKALPARADAMAWCKRMRAEGRTFAYVFADPPFQDDFSCLKDAVLGVLAPGGTAIIQFPSRNPPAWVGQAAKLKKYGDSSLAFFT